MKKGSYRHRYEDDDRNVLKLLDPVTEIEGPDCWTEGAGGCVQHFWVRTERRTDACLEEEIVNED